MRRTRRDGAAPGTRPLIKRAPREAGEDPPGRGRHYKLHSGSHRRGRFGEREACRAECGRNKRQSVTRRQIHIEHRLSSYEDQVDKSTETWELRWTFSNWKIPTLSAALLGLSRPCHALRTQSSGNGGTSVLLVWKKRLLMKLEGCFC